MVEIRDLINYAVNNNASDILIGVGTVPYLRIYTELVTMKIQPLTLEEVEGMLRSFLSEEKYNIFQSKHELDIGIVVNDNQRCRVNVFYNSAGPAFVVRLIPNNIRDLTSLGVPALVSQLCSLRKGLILVTGPSTSGKSTTLAAMVSHINQNFYRHIITIEDPIEYIHKSNNSLINQREVGVHTISFETALKSALRQNPDIILIGELRDIYAMQVALTAAETGHLVLASLHTSSAPQTISRFIEVFPTEQQNTVRSMLSNSLEAIICQRMFRKLDGSGMVAAFELMYANKAIRHLIKENKEMQLYSQMQIAVNSGMVIMKDNILKLLEQGIISKENAINAISFEEATELNTVNRPQENF